MRAAFRTLALLLVPLPGAAAQRPDSLQPDSLRRVRLPEVTVTVTRDATPLARLPVAAAVIGREALREGQPTLGLDEALTTVPGVHVANRWNFSLDQRLSIRGFGSRANFGVRGVKVLLDGVPQTLPDGQSQLTNVDYALVDRVEVLRGAASALYGNAAGGVLHFRTEDPPPGRWAAGLRSEAGSFGTTRWTLRSSLRAERLALSAGLSRMVTDGFRAHSAADIRQLTGAATYDLGPTTRLGLRFAAGDTPRSQNPGALTRTEAEADPAAASPNNVRRGADKRVAQQQLSLSLAHTAASGWGLRVALYGIRRELDNPLAAPPPGPFSPTAGTYNAIDRLAGGVRGELSLPVGEGRLTLGLDAQRMRDDRVNRRSDGGTPTAVVLADQREAIAEVGPFAQLHFPVGPRVVLQGGLRWDRVTFDIRDRYLADGEDSSGRRAMSEASANLGALLALGGGVSAHAAVSTAFETPTSTELVATASGGIGLNPDLGPQRATGLELGLRRSGRLAFSATVFANRVRDAIVQAREQDGRAFFTNAARLNNDGVELGLDADPAARFGLGLAYTYARYRFATYRLRNGATVDTLDGRRLAGVPRHYLRGTLRVRPAVGLRLSLDQLVSSALFADDRNQIEVAGWGAGVTHLRASWPLRLGGARLEPFAAVMNLFDRAYVGAVTVNGAAGRVFEPAPGRHLFLGLDAGWAAGGERP